MTDAQIMKMTLWAYVPIDMFNKYGPVTVITDKFYAEGYYSDVFQNRLTDAGFKLVHSFVDRWTNKIISIINQTEVGAWQSVHHLLASSGLYEFEDGFIFLSFVLHGYNLTGDIVIKETDHGLVYFRKTVLK